MSALRRFFPLLLLSLLLVFPGCGQKKEPLTIGALPIIDNLPFWVAEEKGYFKEAGLEVRFISFPSAVERDSAFTAGKIDLAVGDLLAVAQMRQGGTKVKAIAVAQGRQPGEARFALLSAPNSHLTSVAELRNVPVACSLKTINEYLVDQMLKDAGIPPQEIKKVSIPKIPVRLEALLNGTVKAALLPEPFASLAEAKGAHLLADSSQKNLAQTVIIVREEVLDRHLPELKRLLEAYNRAVADIQQNPQAFNRILEEKAQVPKEVLPGEKHGIKLVFSPATLPTQGEVEAVLDWLKTQGLLAQPLTYSDLVDQRVLKR
ncbi:ABC transporter substrate-binding protein [Ammonifex thiophilus]|uniref:Myristoyl transferase n=1 Tax=Ammonifex thiophilus TaxID=444093 RepID=A0A3D8P7M5_9THEO|nr:MetQ/NlpA family ABC transporter substrate-binding protein [Ammonifex thiophilus]RDV84882.1 myristoyl transferase [Ammonifex thiophilus]